MSRARVHNFTVSLDGFGTGDGRTREAPFGHAGERLHEWMFATRWWDSGGSSGVDDTFVRRSDLTWLTSGSSGRLQCVDLGDRR